MDKVLSQQLMLIIQILILIILFSVLKTQNHMFLSSLYQQKFLARDLKDHFIIMNTKQKVRMKTQQMNINIFLNQILLELIYFLFQFIQIKIPILKDLKLEDIIYQKTKSKKNHVIINGKNFYDHAIDSDIKQFEETRKKNRTR